MSGVPEATSAASRNGTLLSPIRTWPPPARRLNRMARSARLASRSNVASPPTGASSAPNAASDGAARAITLGVTGDSLARRCVSLAPAASVADSVSRACCSPTARAKLGGPVHPAFRPSGEVDLRLRRPPGEAEVAIHHHDPRVVDAHDDGAVRTARSSCAPDRCRPDAPAPPAGRRSALPAPSAPASPLSVASVRLPRSRLSVPSAARTKRQLRRIQRRPPAARRARTAVRRSTARPRRAGCSCAVRPPGRSP